MRAMMQPTAFLSFIAEFSQRPVPALQTRHVYLWHGSVEQLRSAVPNDVHVRLDLRALALALPGAPNSRDQVVRLLRQAISDALATQLDLQRQQVITVTGCDLLSRYGQSLQMFFQVASEHVMVVFAVELPHLNAFRDGRLPDYVLVQPSATYEYLRTTVGESATVNVGEVAQ